MATIELLPFYSFMPRQKHPSGGPLSGGVASDVGLTLGLSGALLSPIGAFGDAHGLSDVANSHWRVEPLTTRNLCAAHSVLPQL